LNKTNRSYTYPTLVSKAEMLDHLAEVTGLTAAQVEASLDEVTAAGWIKIEPAPGGLLRVTLQIPDEVPLDT
jgi:hypothetical protein